MRGEDGRSGSLFSYVDLEAGSEAASAAGDRGDREPGAGRAFGRVRGAVSHTGRPGIAPEKLLRALLLQAFYSIRSERRLMQELEFNLLYRWFVGLGIDDAVWDATVFCKNRDRLLAGDVAARFLARLLAQPGVKRLLSGEHFSVDGTLIEAWASIKSFRPLADGGDGGEEDGPGAGGPSGAQTVSPLARWPDGTCPSKPPPAGRFPRRRMLGRNHRSMWSPRIAGLTCVWTRPSLAASRPCKRSWRSQKGTA
jgi:transposase